MPQGPRSGLDSERRTPYRRTSTHSSPVASCARQSGAEGQSRGSGWDRVVTVPPRTIIRRQSAQRLPRDRHRLQSSERLPGAAISLPGLHCPRVEGSATAASLGGQLAHPCLCTLRLNHRVCSELLE